MTSEWQHFKLSEVIELIGGGTPKTTVPEYWNGDIPWLSVVDFNGVPRWVSKAEKSITAKGLENSATRLLQSGDIIISARGTVGALAQLTKPMAFNQSCYGIRGKEGIADTNFIFYVLRQAVIELKRLAHGGVFDTITKDSFNSVNILLPALYEQHAIARLFGALDEQITLLRETNTTLQDIAQTLFESWFVRFDPVRAKADGCLPKGLPLAVIDLFPSEFEESQFGLIPKGWRIVPFLESVSVVGGGTPKTSVEAYWDGEIPWFSVVDTPRDGDMFVIDTEKHITEAGVLNSSTRLLRRGTTIISARGTVGKIAMVGREMAMNQSCYGLQGSAIGDFQTFFATQRLVSILKQRSHGSVFETITRETLAGVSVVVSSTPISSAFEKLVGTLLERVRCNVEEAVVLANLRDTLLPRLMSGKLRVDEVAV